MVNNFERIIKRDDIVQSVSNGLDIIIIIKTASGQRGRSSSMMSEKGFSVLCWPIRSSRMLVHHC